MQHDPDDSALVAQAKAGDFDAFEQLVSRHEQRAYVVAMGILRQRQDAEDAVQTAFLNALEHLDRFREEAAFGTWLTRVVVNTALKALRKRKGLATVPLAGGAADDDETGEIPHPELIAPWPGDPAHVVARQDLRRILDEAIDALPDKHRLVFVLRDIQGLSVRHTAQVLGISEPNVKVRLLRARLALRERLTRIFGDEARRLYPPPDHGTERATPVAQLLRSYQTG